MRRIRRAGGVLNVSELDRAIQSLRAGDSAVGDIRAFVDGARLSAAASALFRAALQEGSDVERKRLVHALEAIGQRLDPLFERGSILVRDAACIALLVDPGLAVMGQARDTAIDVLLTCVPTQLLQPVGQKLVEHLRAHPDDLSLRLIAKARLPAARIEIAKLMTMPQRAVSESVKLAYAALGNATVEQEFIQAFLSTHDAAEKARTARLLGYIGSPNALKALAREMRCELVVATPGVMRRSVRLDIIAALRMSYPDKVFLWDQAIRDDSGYQAVEDFCVQHLGARYRTPRPPFLWLESARSAAR